MSLQIDNTQIQVVDEVKLLGTIITSDLKWGKNVDEIIRRGNTRMIILRKLAEFKAKQSDMRIIYIAYIRSILEQLCVVWNFSITDENSTDIERVQKNACKIILGYQYENYESALTTLNLEDLKSRRIRLCKKFAITCLENRKTRNMFPKYRKERLKQSAIPQMQRLLNN